MHKVAFIIQGNNKIGFGHVFRSLRIANILKKDYDIIFYSLNYLAKKIIAQNGFKCFFFKKKQSIKNYYTVIVDKLNNSDIFIKKLSKFNRKILIIDDKKNFKYNNINKINFLYFPELYKNYRIINNLKFHIPIENTVKNKFNKKIKKILIIQGSSDPHNNLIKIFGAIRPIISNNIKINFYFHLGLKNIDKPQFKKLFFYQKYFDNLIITSKISNFSKVFEQCDLALTACGITALDLLYYNTPCIYISNEYKELQTAKTFHELGIGRCFGKISIKKQKKLQYFLDDLINNYKLRLIIYKSMQNINLINSKKNFLKLLS